MMSSNNSIQEYMHVHTDDVGEQTEREWMLRWHAWVSAPRRQCLVPMRCVDLRAMRVMLAP